LVTRNPLLALLVRAGLLPGIPIAQFHYQVIGHYG
jgi:hypothetical protein